MSRQEKKTRIRVVPPKLQLRGQDALTGSYPTNVRFSTDGRTGNYKVGYNDVQTVVFGTGSFGTSWQDNLVGYWTMQRSGPPNSVVGDLTFEGEISGSLGTGIYPFLDFNLAKPGDSQFDKIGVTESYAHYGKGYDVNLQYSAPVAPLDFPYIQPNKSYDFNPYFSPYATLSDPSTPKSSIFPLLVQRRDSDKELFGFTTLFGDPGKQTLQPFSFAGWFYFKTTSDLSLNTALLIAGPCRIDPWSISRLDYSAIVQQNASGDLRFSIRLISGSAIGSSMLLTTDYISSNNDWFHFAFTYDGNMATSLTPANIDTIKVYANGNRVNPMSFTQIGTGFNGYNTGSKAEYGISSLRTSCGVCEVTGSVAEFGFFNRVLSGSEIAEIYYSQVPWHKKRRVIAGTSIDLDNDPYPVDAGEYMTNFNRDGMLVTGSIVKGVGDNPEWVHFSPGQEMQPFHDEQQFAADAKGATVQNPFFATGSAETLVGEGFNSPLWSKNKIEIPIPVVADAKFKLPKAKHTTGATTVLTYDSPMGYYNFEKNVWEPVGIGIAIDASSLELYQQYLTVGFFNGFITTQSYDPGFEELFGSLNINQAHTIGCCGSDLGFPYHPKYHATSSQTLDMSQYINEPFLLEKAILELGPVTFEVGNINLTRANNVISGSVSTFFLLNQRKNQNFQYSKQQIAFVTGSNAIIYVSASVPADTYLNKDDAFSLTPTRVDTIRDIVGYSQLYSFAYTVLDTVVKRNNIPGTFSPVTSSIRNLIPFKNNDILIENGNVSSISGVNYNQYLPIFSMSMCTPAYAGLKLAANIGSTNITTKYYPGAGGGRDSIYISFDGTRTGLNTTQLSTRGLNNDLFFSENIEKSVSFPDQFIYPKEKYKENPYILYPHDKLILGCQSPVSQEPAYTTIFDPASTNAECVLTLSQSININNPKLILYGSYIRENKEYNDGTNQLLSSETIHEVIE